MESYQQVAKPLAKRWSKSKELVGRLPQRGKELMQGRKRCAQKACREAAWRKRHVEQGAYK